MPGLLDITNGGAATRTPASAERAKTPLRRKRATPRRLDDSGSTDVFSTPCQEMALTPAAEPAAAAAEPAPPAAEAAPSPSPSPSREAAEAWRQLAREQRRWQALEDQLNAELAAMQQIATERESQRLRMKLELAEAVKIADLAVAEADAERRQADAQAPPPPLPRADAELDSRAASLELRESAAEGWEVELDRREVELHQRSAEQEAREAELAERDEQLGCWATDLQSREEAVERAERTVRESVQRGYQLAATSSRDKEEEQEEKEPRESEQQLQRRSRLVTAREESVERRESELALSTQRVRMQSGAIHPRSRCIQSGLNRVVRADTVAERESRLRKQWALLESKTAHATWIEARARRLLASPSAAEARPG